MSRFVLSLATFAVAMPYYSPAPAPKAVTYSPPTPPPYVKPSVAPVVKSEPYVAPKPQVQPKSLYGGGSSYSGLGQLKVTSVTQGGKDLYSQKSTTEEKPDTAHVEEKKPYTPPVVEVKRPYTPAPAVE